MSCRRDRTFSREALPEVLRALVAAAVSAGITCVLTQDRLFAESAALAAQQFLEFAVVLVRLSQRPWRQYCEAVRASICERYSEAAI